MKTAIFALALAASFGAATIPAFAESNAMDRSDSANSLPPGFYNNTPFGIQAQIVEQHFANKGEASWQAQRGITPLLPPQTLAHPQTQPQNHG